MVRMGRRPWTLTALFSHDPGTNPSGSRQARAQCNNAVRADLTRSGDRGVRGRYPTSGSPSGRDAIPLGARNGLTREGFLLTRTAQFCRYLGVGYQQNPGDQGRQRPDDGYFPRCRSRPPASLVSGTSESASCSARLAPTESPAIPLRLDSTPSGEFAGDGRHGTTRNLAFAK